MSERDPDLHPARTVLERNIRTLAERRAREESQAGVQERVAEAITRFTGSMAFVYLHLLAFGAWVLANAGWLPGVPRFDPSFVGLASFASVEAIFLSTFVLISQNRMATIAEKRAELDLQVNLLAEHEVTRLIAMVEAIARRLDAGLPQEDELQELKSDVRPETVMAEIETVAKPKRSPEGGA